MEGKLIALILVALLIGLGVGYSSAYMSVANMTKEVDVKNFPALWAANVTNFPTSWTLSVPTVYTSINVGQKFNWSIAEVVSVQQNYYVYAGHDICSVYWEYTGGPCVGTIHLARWLNGWVDLYYKDGSPQNVSLSPYTLQILYYSNNYLTAMFL